MEKNIIKALIKYYIKNIIVYQIRLYYNYDSKTFTKIY